MLSANLSHSCPGAEDFHHHCQKLQKASKKNNLGNYTLRGDQTRNSNHSKLSVTFFMFMILCFSCELKCSYKMHEYSKMSDNPECV